MKTICIALHVFIITSLSSIILAQEVLPEKKVTITYNWSRIKSYGSNQIAVWIEDVNGNHVCTLFATRFTTNGGYVKRPVSLSEWTAKFDIKNAKKEDIDAITGATPPTSIQTFTWNCKDKSGKELPIGTYIVRLEANILDSNKMFFRGEIKIGGEPQQTSGLITYSSPSLASGNILFKDVLVEYK
jgi:hypothetical protein